MDSSKIIVCCPRAGGRAHRNCIISHGPHIVNHSHIHHSPHFPLSPCPFPLPFPLSFPLFFSQLSPFPLTPAPFHPAIRPNTFRLFLKKKKKKFGYYSWGEGGGGLADCRENWEKDREHNREHDREQTRGKKGNGGNDAMGVMRGNGPFYPDKEAQWRITSTLHSMRTFLNREQRCHGFARPVPESKTVPRGRAPLHEKKSKKIAPAH